MMYVQPHTSIWRIARMEVCDVTVITGEASMHASYYIHSRCLYTSCVCALVLTSRI